MRELFEIFPKLQGFLNFFWLFSRFEGYEIGQKRCKIECPDVSGTILKNSLLKPWENYHFSTFISIFSTAPSKHLALPCTSKLFF